VKHLDKTIAMLNGKRDKVLAELHPELRRRVILLMNDLGGRLTPYCGYRGPKEQAAAKEGGFSKAKWLQSPHNYAPALACDLVLHPVMVQLAPHKKSPDYPNLWDELSVDAVRAWADMEIAAKRHGLVRVTLDGKRDFPHVELPDWRRLIVV